MYDRRYMLAATVIFATVFTQPLIDDMKDVFGTTLLYHPLSVLLVLFSVVYMRTDSLEIAVVVVCAYQLLKYFWRKFRPETPKIARLRRILHHARRDIDMDKEDIKFIDEVTPKEVTFSKTTA